MIEFAATPDIAISDSKWTLRQPVVTTVAPGPFRPGWYRVRLNLHTPETPAIRKRLELRFDSSTEVETREWNERIAVSLWLQLKQHAQELRLKLFHCTGTIQVHRCEVKRVARATIALAAVREKLRLVSAYGCLRPVLWRGVGLVARGQFRTLGRKLFKGLADGKVMRPEAYRANEADAAWWRRHTLPAEVAERLRAACDAMPNPKPIAVMIRVTDGEEEYARLSAESVRRQIYPHWELFVVSDRLPVELGEWAARDERVTRLDCESELSLPKVRALCRSEHVVELPTSMELAEDALYRVAVEGSDEIQTRAVGRQHAQQLSTIQPTNQQSLMLVGELNGINGYDAVVFALLNGLPAHGFRLSRPPSVKVRDDLLPPHLRPVVRQRTPDDWQLVVFPPFALDKFTIDRRTVVYTMWETDELLPKWVRVMNRAARVIVPSQWGANCFRANGVTVPIDVVPLGYDACVYHPVEVFSPPLVEGRSVVLQPTSPQRGEAEESRSFAERTATIFGTAGALAAGGMRKNAQHLIELFRAAFPTEPDVRLRVKLSPTSPAIEEYSDSRIDVIRASMTPQALANWYRSLTAYVNGSFGEGFGLHLIEAMACGRPLITPNTTGLTEFFTPECGYEVGSSPVPVRNDIYRGRWQQPCDADIIAALREVYTDRAAAARRGVLAAERAKAFTWANCCAGLAKVVTSLS